ncbi:MAG: glutamine--fructose-6-phosphate transaminase (isomerizing) [Candidatus Cloacimonetes bacterium]|nr:glutamine--fructose-6-phosphate transaminase (isomerizing) [Candidatus Cloacimonadota bacterium]MBS3767199.1 glutamine--fructose-6-phosphate transaminase (isomerizing) [Candidatus Cloacimonadota bacterium]
MCGIVGYIGKQETLPILIEGIKRLEYRGYDSAGIAVINDKGELIIHKRSGKIVEMEKTLPDEKNFNSCLGIAHTRWATHGEPSTTNAHPHLDCENKIAIVHNGIIENYKVLKKNLQNEGHKFNTDTDTEVLAHLIEEVYDKINDFHKAVNEALKLVEGTYGLVVISKDEPQKIIAARKGSPLIIGVGEEENYIASDVAALVVHTKNVIYLKDNETAEITKDSFKIRTLANESVAPIVKKINWDISMIEKGDFDYFMQKEIYEQPDSIENAFRGRLNDELNTARLGGVHLNPEQLENIKQIVIVACGTSWHAGLVGEYMIESMARIPVKVQYASEFRYRDPIIDHKTLVISISQSGETADTLAAIREAREKGAKVMGITNVIGSTIARETDFGSYIHAGAEIGVASTKAFTSQLTVLFLLGWMLGRMRLLTPEIGAKYGDELKKIPEKVTEIISYNDYIKEIVEASPIPENALYLGRGINYPVALEGALKLKEISYIHAEGYPAAEMKHGPIALIDENMPVIFIAPDDYVYDKILSNIEEVRARKGKVIAITNKSCDGIKDMADHVIFIPKTISLLSPLLTVIPLQLLSLHYALAKGCDVDQPRNLAKSVTVE